MVDKNRICGQSYTGGWTGKTLNFGSHNTKTGWVMMRVYYLTGDKKYLTAAQKIDSAQRKYMWDKNTADGF